MLKNKLKVLRENNYAILKEIIFITDLTLTVLIFIDIMIKFIPLVVGAGILGKASQIIIGLGSMEILPPAFVAIHDKLLREE